MTFRRIVVGIDGRSGGRDALELARTLGGPGAAIALVHAYAAVPAVPGVATGGLAPVMRDDAMKMLEEAAEDDGRLELVAVAEAVPGRALHDAAESRGADLICVGSCHHRELGRLRLGDAATATLHGAPCPVAVASTGYAYEGLGLERIAVAYDGRPSAVAALELAESLASFAGASLTLRCVIERDDPALRSRAQSMLDEALARLDVPADGAVLVGDADTALAALSHTVDLLVASSRGLGPVRRVVAGSTTDHLARTAACPLLVSPGRAA